MSNLSWLRKYVWRNPYTGAATFDVEAAETSPEFRELMRQVWDAGYESGFADGDGDSYVETQSVNPFK